MRHSMMRHGTRAHFTTYVRTYVVVHCTVGTTRLAQHSGHRASTLYFAEAGNANVRLRPLRVRVRLEGLRFISLRVALAATFSLDDAVQRPVVESLAWCQRTPTAGKDSVGFIVGAVRSTNDERNVLVLGERSINALCDTAVYRTTRHGDLVARRIEVEALIVH